MSEVIAVGGAISAIKAVFELSKDLVGVRDAAVMQSKVIELQTQILAAQSEAMAVQSDHAALLQAVTELRTEIAGLKAWEAEKHRYELIRLPAETFAYRLRAEFCGDEPSHLICAACFQNGVKAILQPFQHVLGRSTSLDCPACATRIYETGVSHPGHLPPIRPSARR